MELFVMFWQCVYSFIQKKKKVNEGFKLFDFPLKKYLLKKNGKNHSFIETFEKNVKSNDICLFWARF